MIIASDQLCQILDLYERGLFLQAYTLAVALGPLHEWQGTEARLLAGRLAMQLGAPRLGRRLHRLAWREDPKHLETRYYRARHRMERSGPLATWELLRREGDLTGATPEQQAIWLA